LLYPRARVIKDFYKSIPSVPNSRTQQGVKNIPHKSYLLALVIPIDGVALKFGPRVKCILLGCDTHTERSLFLPTPKERDGGFYF
jgi:hypothetical protein